MRFIDVHDLAANSTIATDICVVGSGAAGMTVATQLDGASQQVCLIESGGYVPDEQVQALYDMQIAGYPVRENFMSRARYFGGSCNIWAGRSMRLTELDMQAREWVPYSGWPMTYAELARYYPEAGRILRLPSFESFERDILTRRMGHGEKTLFGNDDLQPNISMWARKPLRFGAAFAPQLRRSRNITVYMNASVTHVLLNCSGTAVDELAASTIHGKRLRIKARRFVLACGGLENARLLLVSRDVQSHGIGNQYDVVGRYFMDHPRTVFGKVKFHGTQRLPLLLGMPLADGMAQVGIQLSASVQQRERLLNNYLSLERHWSPQTAQAYQSFVHTMKILLRKGYSGKRFALSGAQLAKVPELIYLLAPRELMPHALYRFCRIMKNRLSGGVQELIMVNYCDQVPNPASRVYLSHERDRLNVNRLILDWKVGKEEMQSLLRLQELLDQYLKQHHLGYVEKDLSSANGLVYTDASHHIGTTRMSDSPRDGVVDKHCRVHGVGNLYLAGSSVFPTAGHANPTLTIVALSIRLAEHLKHLPDAC